MSPEFVDRVGVVLACIPEGLVHVRGNGGDENHVLLGEQPFIDLQVIAISVAHHVRLHAEAERFAIDGFEKRNFNEFFDVEADLW